MRTLLDRKVEGMVLISQYCSSPKVRELLGSGTPFVLVQRRNENFKDDYVGSDNVGGIVAAIRHLYKLGHRRIGWLRGPADSSSAHERNVAFEAESRRLRLEMQPEFMFGASYTLPGGYQAGMHFLSLARPPTAVMASSDVSAIGLMQAVIDSGLSVPKDMSVTGIDDIALAAFHRIELTTIRQQRREMGSAAARLLLKRIRGLRGRPRSIITPTELVVRGSTAPPGSRKTIAKPRPHDGARANLDVS